MKLLALISLAVSLVLAAVWFYRTSRPKPDERVDKLYGNLVDSIFDHIRMDRRAR